MNKDNLLRELAAEYERLREEDREEELRRRAEVTARDGAIGELLTRREELFRSKAREAFDNPDRAMAISADLTRETERIQAELCRRLAALGCPADYLQPVEHCAKCHDTGYVGDTVRERCECLEKRLQERMAGQTGNGVDPEETFERFDPSVFPLVPVGRDKQTTQREYMLRMRDRCESFADAFPHPAHRNLLFCGSSGLGKTFLMNCVANRVRQRGGTVLKLTAYQLTERMRSAAFGREPEAFQTLLEVPLLMIDDLGAEAMLENLSIVYLFNLLNERELAKLSTVISTNLTLREFRDRYTERICSRLFDPRATLTCAFYGQDVRLGLKGKEG